MVDLRRSEAAHPRIKTPVKYPASLALDHAGPIIIEVGPGRGDFLYHLAAAHPEALIVGIEIKPKRTDLLIARLQKRGIANVVVIQGDAREVLPQVFKECSVSEIHVNFPDPWPKRRHGRNRVMSEEFLHACVCTLAPSGTLFFATDDKPYADQVIKTAARIEGLSSCIEGGVAKDVDDAFPTYFAQKWKDMGRTLYYQRYVKKTDEIKT
jgi:tRNA (guanine-N7-)-methyltransferase